MPRLRSNQSTNKQKEIFHQRSFVCLIFIIFCFSALIIRLSYLQIWQHANYSTLSTNNRIALVPIPPIRGIIYDRNNVILAENKPAFSLEIIPEQIHQPIAKIIDNLSKFLSIRKFEKKQFFRSLHNKHSFEGTPLLLNMDEIAVAKFAVNKFLFPGVEIKTNLIRYYPLGAYMVPVLGYVSRINEQELSKLDASNYHGTQYVGKIGIEKHYEDILHGKVGSQKIEINAQGRTVRILEKHAADSGKDIHLTIDSRLQYTAYHALNNKKGAIVAIDPQNGDILAMVSKPSYNPNLFVTGISSKNYNALKISPSQPLFNRAIRGQYPPASTIKPIIALMGLKEHIIDSEYNIYDPGWFQLPHDLHVYHDWKRRGGHGTVNVHKAIVESCDTFFYNLATKIGIDRIDDIMHKFGFGQYTDIDLNEELPGLVPSPTWKKTRKREAWYPGETVITAIGQGFLLATPLQMANATAMLANHGKLWQPHLLQYTYDKEIQKTDNFIPKLKQKITLKEPNIWRIIQDAMINVINDKHGTAHRLAYNLNYKLAGKTGTAQVFSIKQNELYSQIKIDQRLYDHALFIAYAPADNPKIAVAAIVENGAHDQPKASTIVKKVIDNYLANIQKNQQTKS